MEDKDLSNSIGFVKNRTSIFKKLKINFKKRTFSK